MFRILPLLTLALLSQPSSATPKTEPCTAGLIFLKTFEKHDHKSVNSSFNLPESPNPQQSPETYTISITYPCPTSPLERIEKVKKSIPDPFISFYLSDKPAPHHHVARSKRSNNLHLQDYGSGRHTDDDDEYDDEEEDEEEDEEDEDDDIEIPIDNEIVPSAIFPSSHVMLNLPTPTVRLEEHHHTLVFDYNLVSSSPQQRLSSGFISPTPTTQSASPSSYSVPPPHDDDLVPIFSAPGGSGDGPVLSTPLYNPTTSESSFTTEQFVSSSSTPGQGSSSSSPTPVLPSSHLLHPIQKQLIYSGSPHTFTIPLNTFHPPCSSYELLQPEPWVQIQNGGGPSSVNFFPTRSQISDYRLTLECRPYGSTAEMFVSVRQRQRSRLHNHEFSLEFGMLRGEAGRVEVLNRIVAEIRDALNSNGTNDLVVLSTELDSYPFRVTYVNESIISNVCPVTELKQIYDNLQKLPSSFIKLESVNLLIPQDNNQCDASVIQTITGVSPSNQGNYGENYPPSIKNQIDRLNGTVGEYLVYHVREDFCYDPEDGGTRNLKVELRSNEMVEIDEAYWLQFDGKNQEFYGLAMGVETREFVLVCSDRGGKSANDVLELQILPPKTLPTSYYTEFNINFQSIPFTPKAIRKFIEKLSSLLSPHIQVHSYSESNSHVLFKYFNTTNPSTEHEVTEIRKVLLSDDGPVNKLLFEHFTPEFNVTVVSVVPLRGLLSENNPVVGGGGGMVVEGGDVLFAGGGGGGDEVERNRKGGVGGGGRYFDFDSGEDAHGNRGVGGGGGGKLDIENIVNVDSYSGYLTTYIIPSVLIAIMILLALIIACLLSRKNKYTQASTEDDSSSPNSRVYLKNAKKGVPVIFQDELDEKLFGGEHGGAARGEGQPQTQRAGVGGNIYEQHTPQQPPPQNSTNTTPQNTTPSRLTSPTPSAHNRYPNQSNTPHHTHHHQPQPPDYQNSISRSMMRNNRPSLNHHNYPAGGIQVYPPQPPHHHPHHHNPYGYSDPYRSPPPQPHIDSYQPPPGINYYGIHNSNSGGSGFSERTTASGIIGPSSQNQQMQQHHGGNSSKMAPPPYVPP